MKAAEGQTFPMFGLDFGTLRVGPMKVYPSIVHDLKQRFNFSKDCRQRGRGMRTSYRSIIQLVESMKVKGASKSTRIEISFNEIDIETIKTEL